MTRKTIAYWLAGSAAVLGFNKARKRLLLSKAKHRSLTGHVRMAKQMAGQIPHYEFGYREFFRADGAPDAIAVERQRGLERLSELYRTRYPKSVSLAAEAREGIPDVDFTSRYRVPFPFSAIIREKLATGAAYIKSDGVMLTDLDGNQFYDLTGSYGVNLLGTDSYKALSAEGMAMMADIGPHLGGLHPATVDNMHRLKAISGLDAVSFHMSGTEAVMQAVRLARYHTGRSHLVRFAGAYHGWWGDVQPGIGNPTPADNTYTLADMSDATLEVLATRKDIACVLVNPLQAMHPNSSAPGDSALVDSSRRAEVNRQAYTRWLRKLATTCRQNGIVLIVDEVFTGFRLAERGACEYFGIKPDMVTYGKTLGGGLPIGVVCGSAELMKRYRDDRPADICFARGTFNSHPYVMGAMNAFLKHMERPETKALYRGMDTQWNGRAASLNAMLEKEGLPLRIANLGTIWTCFYTTPSRYNWMLQFYLGAEGLALSWVGTGRFIFSLAYSADDFDEVARRFVAAAKAMEKDGWWWCDGHSTNKDLKRLALKEMLRSRFG